jgi:hypothetical protein
MIGRDFTIGSSDELMPEPSSVSMAGPWRLLVQIADDPDQPHDVRARAQALLAARGSQAQAPGRA